MRLGITRCVSCWIELDIRQNDDSCSDGVYAIPRFPKEPRIKVRAKYDYCQQKGEISPEDLTPEEMERFLVSDKERN